MVPTPGPLWPNVAPYSSPLGVPYRKFLQDEPTVYMTDSIEAPQITGHPIPQAILDAPAVAGYNHGNSWPSYAPYAAARPDLVKSGRLVSITLSAFYPARCLDMEQGGALISQAPGWFRDHADHTDGKPILYTFASQGQEAVNTMSAAGIGRDKYYLWLAHWTYHDHICAPNICGYPAADGTQWTDKVAGNCDGSTMYAYVFGAQPVIITIPEDPMALSAIVKPAKTGEQARVHIYVEVPKDKDDSTKGCDVYELYQTPNGATWEGAKKGVKALAYHLASVPSA